jgi:hypothetical protein
MHSDIFVDVPDEIIVRFAFIPTECPLTSHCLLCDSVTSREQLKGSV